MIPRIGLSAALFIISVAIPLFILVFNWIPPDENPKVWFQRSGSVMVIFSLLSEFTLLPLYNTLFPGENTVTVNIGKVEIWRSVYSVVSALTLVTAVLGTAIWGYGDLWL